MIKLVVTNEKNLELYELEKVHVGENKFGYYLIFLPEVLNGFALSECNVELVQVLADNTSVSINIDTTQQIRPIQENITLDVTATAQTVTLSMLITHNGDIIGKTNQVTFEVHPTKNATPIDPREELDEIIAELRAENAELSETVCTQAEQIEAKDGQISELNDEITEKDGQITELNTENTRLENLTDTQRETIQNMLDNPPQPKLYTPPVVTPSGSVQQINPPTGYDGLNNAVVDRVSAEGVGFNPDYYKEGETCLGKVGTYNPFPERSYGGIYYTELGEGGYPKKILIKDMLRSASTIPQFFDTSNDAKRELREVIFENCPGFLKTAGNLFNGFNYLTKVLLPDSLTSIGGYAFNGCTSLTELTLPDSLTSIGDNAFQDCTSLTELTLPDSLTSIGGNAFGYCTSLTELTLPDSLTSIGGNAFYNCTRLTRLTLPDSLTSIGNSAFYNCTSLTELTLPDSLTSIGNNAFQNCTSLTELTLAQGFNCNGLNVSWATRFTAETIVACLEALADRTGQTAYTITFGTTNLNKLTAEEKAIATNKNWNLA